MTEDALTLDLSKVDELAADFLDDFRSFLAPLRSSTVSWVDAGEQFRDRMEPEQYLAWAWSQRRIILTDQLRRACDRALLNDKAAAGQGDEGAVESVVADLTHRAAKRNGRVEKARLELRGRLSEHFDVPDKGSMPVGLMTSPDLLAAAKNLQGQAHTLMRKARFLRRLAKGLPQGATVVEHYTQEKVESMWATFSALAS